MVKITKKSEILKAIKMPGKIFVHTILDYEFPVEKQAAIEFVKLNDCYLLVDTDGYKRLEANH